MQPTLDLPAEYLHRLRTVVKKHAADAEIWAYGSRVNGTGHEASDLDLVLRNPQDLARPYGNLGGLKQALADSSLPILVDIVDWARIPASFREEINRNHVVVHEPQA